MKKSLIYTIVFAITCLFTITELLKAIVHMFKHIDMYWWFLGGGVLYLIVGMFILEKSLSFLQTLSHKSLHMVACLMMFRKVESIKASAIDGSMISSNMFITLAPYIMPVITILLLFMAIVFYFTDVWSMIVDVFV